MRSLNRLGTFPASLPLSADEIVEFHAARLLLLLHACGTAGRIDGLTKMAKLDFFARYPEFFEVARASETAGDTKHEVAQDEEINVANSPVESAMVRHHYGPWDKRYYHILAHLEAKGLVTISKEGKAYRIALTDLGRDRSRQLAEMPSYASLVDRMSEIKKTFGAKTGNSLKILIYRLFDQEVSRQSMGQEIHR